MSSRLEEGIERGIAALSIRYVLMFMAVVVFLMAWNRGIALLYAMFWLLIAALLVGYTTPYWNMRGVSARREHGDKAYEGEDIVIGVDLRRAAPGSAYMLEVVDHIPFADEERQESMGFVPRLKGEARVELHVPCDLRGEHTLGPLRLRSAYPLGIKTVEREVSDSETRILVYPKAFNITRMDLIGATQTPISGTRAARVSGGNDEVFGVREYRHGDSPRHVHWPASARRGELVVREYEFINRTDVLILLDLHKHAQYGSGKQSTLEYAVKIAASIAQYALREGHGVGLLGFGAQREHVPVAYGSRHYQPILEVLARVKADGGMPYSEAVHQAVANMRQGGIVVLFELTQLPQGDARERIELHEHHLRALRIHFDANSFDSPLGAAHRRAPRADADNYYVRRGDSLEKIFT